MCLIENCQLYDLCSRSGFTAIPDQTACLLNRTIDRTVYNPKSQQRTDISDFTDPHNPFGSINFGKPKSK